MALDLSELLLPGRVALLLSEVQRSVIGDQSKLAILGKCAAEVGVIPNSARLAEAARSRRAPVVHCLASTDPQRFGASNNAPLFRGAAKRAASADRPPHDPAGDTPCPEVWCEGDVLSRRDHGLSPMADSQLDHRLRNRGITTVILTGVSLNVALINLAMDAVNHSYQVIIARDAVAGVPVEYTESVMKNTLTFIATIATSDEIIAAWGKV